MKNIEDIEDIEEIRFSVDIEEIGKAIKEYDLILMIIDGVSMAEGLTDKFCNSEALRQARKKILILSEADLAPMNTCTCKFVKISNKERNALERLYGMYEFSDRFRVFSDNSQWGSLLNYVKTGIMTLEEVFQVLLI